MHASSVKHVLINRLAIIQACEAELFDKQLQLIKTKRKLTAVHAGRRAGKSETLIRAAFIACCYAGRKHTIILGAETLKKARSLYWSDLLALRLRLGLQDWAVNKTEGTIESPWGAVIRLWGVSDDNAIQLLRGFKIFEAWFDEVGSYEHHLQTLQTQVMQPALSDSRNNYMGGRLFYVGTPSETSVGAWFKICSGKIPGWSIKHWTAMHNPHFPNPKAMLDDILKLNAWSPNEPTFLREYLGQFVNDASKLVFKLNHTKHIIDELPPHYEKQEWIHSIGVDFGYNDECAWVVLASHPHEKVTYVIHAEKHAELYTDLAAEITEKLCKQFDPQVLVGDSGGLGKPYLEEINRRNNIPLKMIPADKQNKRGQIDIINSELTRNAIYFLRDAAAALLSEMQSLPWNKSRTEMDSRYDNHCSDGFIYCSRHHRAYLNEGPRPRQTAPQIGSVEWRKLDTQKYTQQDQTEWWDQ